MNPRFSDEDREEIKQIVHEALREFFTGYGKSGKAALVTAAVIIGSVTVIFAGLKAFLAWIGFSYLSK